MVREESLCFLAFMRFKVNDCNKGYLFLLGSLVGVNISHDGNRNLSSLYKMNKLHETTLEDAFVQMSNSSTRIPIITQTGTIQVKR